MLVLIIGYLAPLLLALSLIVSNSLKFRWLNIAGCSTFMVYGVVINAFPVIIANGILLCINIFQLIKLYTVKETFDMLEVQVTDALVGKFLSFYKKDVNDFFPHFQLKANTTNIAFLVLRDLAIANIFVAELSNDGNAAVQINYTVPQYRDYKVGKFIFEREREYLVSKGVKTIVYNNPMNKNHENFIKVMGFTQQYFNGAICYVNSLL